jgi:iron complex outermembrane recepter protein
MNWTGIMGIRNCSVREFGLCASAIALLVSLPALAQESRSRFAIPSQPLSSGLPALGEAAGISIAAPSTLVAGKRAQTVQGELTTRGALTQMLAGSGLRYEFVGPNAVRIVGERPQTAGAGEAPAADAHIEELIVTGTRIRGQAPVGSELIVLDRADIAQTGRATVPDLLRTIPQNHTLGASESLVGARGQNQVKNDTAASTVNLRGLGADATLVLVNGRRIAPAALGAFVDVSQIPLVAVQRIEILPDGASALYGSDAIGGVVNFVLRKGEDAESSVRYGLASGFHEWNVSQSIGYGWGTGSANLAYEFGSRTNLTAAKRDYYRGDLTPFGGPNYNLISSSGYSNPGTIVVGGRTYAIPAGQNGQALTPASLVAGTQNIQDLQLGQDILPSLKRHSLAGSFNQDAGDSVHLFADVLYSQRESIKMSRASKTALPVPSTNAYFVSPVAGVTQEVVQYSFADEFNSRTASTSKNYTVSAGARFDLPREWSAELYGTLGRDSAHIDQIDGVNSARLALALASNNRATAFNPFGDGPNVNSQSVLNFIRGGGATDQSYDIKSINVGASGPLFDLPGGALRMAVGAEYRKERYSTFGFIDLPELTLTLLPDNNSADRTVKAGYVEFLAPLVGKNNALPFVEKLELSAAVRTEDYSDFGTTTNPKIGVMWQPFDGLSFRGSWGTSFKAPRLSILNEGSNVYRSAQLANSSADPASPSTPFPGASNVIALLGFGNRNLKPETADTWSVGADLRPKFLPGLRASVTYFSVDYENRILAPTSIEVSSALAGSGVNDMVLVRSPTQAQLNAIYNGPQWAVGFPQPPASMVAAIVSLGIANYGAVKMRGLDANASYDIVTPIGTFTPGISVSYLFTYDVQRMKGQTFLPLLNTANNPNRIRGRAALNWVSDGWQAGVAANYIGSYTNTFVAPSPRIGAWTTVDARVAYMFDTQNSWLRGTSLSLDAENLGDRKPPYVNNAESNVGFDPEAASPRGRVIALTLRKSW